MFDPTLNITREEQDTVLSGIAADGSIREEAKAVIMNRMEDVKKIDGYMIGEFKRQFRNNLNGEDGKKIAAVIDQLW